MSKRKLKCLTASEKLKLVASHGTGKSCDELCKHFNIPKSTIYRIIKNKDKLLPISEYSYKWPDDQNKSSRFRKTTQY